MLMMAMWYFMAQREQTIVEEELRNADNRIASFERLEITRVDGIIKKTKQEPAAQI